MILYKNLIEKMKIAGFSTYRLKQEKILSNSTLDRIRDRKSISTNTIDVICELTGLPIQELIEHKPNKENKDFFFVQGVGKVRLDDAMGILTREGKEAVKKNEISLAELGGMYKCRLVQNKAKCGSFEGTFNKCWMRIPADLKEYATVEDLAATVDAFNECYADGMNRR